MISSIVRCLLRQVLGQVSYRSKGHIVTNYHVIEGAQELIVTMLDESRWEAKIVGVDPNNDLAVIKVDIPDDRIKILSMTDSDEVFVGQKV